MMRRVTAILALLLGGCHLVLPHAPPTSSAPDRSAGLDLRSDLKRPDLEVWSIDIPTDCSPPRWPVRPTRMIPPNEALAETLETAGPDETLVLAAGKHTLARAITLTRERVVIRGETGATVEIDASGTKGSIRIAASQVVLANLTITNSASIPVLVEPAGSTSQGVVLHALSLVDAQSAMVRVSPGGGHHSDAGVVACSTLVVTPAYRAALPLASCDLRGLSIHAARGWQLLRNRLTGFYCPKGATQLGTGIELVFGTRDTIVDGNRIEDATMAIRAGLYHDPAPGKRLYTDSPCVAEVDNTGGVIRNNFISAAAADAPVDSGISFWSSCGGMALHNTVWFSAEPFSSSIEWRYAETTVEIANNLLSHPVKARDGATAKTSANLASLPASWLVDPSQGDLHLTANAMAAIDAGVPHPEAPVDIDGQLRDVKPDLGADELGR